MQKKLFMEEYLFTGESEKKARRLLAIIDEESKSTIFFSAIELYITAVIIGCIRNKEIYKTPSQQNLKIMSQQFSNRYDDLKMIYKLIALNSKSNLLSEIDKINNAFKYIEDENNELTIEQIKLFERYMLGGVDYLYVNFFSVKSLRYQDYLVTWFDLLDEFNDDLMAESVVKEQVDFSNLPFTL